jgi:hypothetical protein
MVDCRVLWVVGDEVERRIVVEIVANSSTFALWDFETRAFIPKA